MNSVVYAALTVEKKTITRYADASWQLPGISVRNLFASANALGAKSSPRFAHEFPRRIRPLLFRKKGLYVHGRQRPPSNPINRNVILIRLVTKATAAVIYRYFYFHYFHRGSFTCRTTRPKAVLKRSFLLSLLTYRYNVRMCTHHRLVTLQKVIIEISRGHRCGKMLEENIPRGKNLKYKKT